MHIPFGATLTTQLLSHLQTRPNAVAIHLLRTGEPEKAITYIDLLNHATRVAQVLEEQGVVRGDVLVLILPHGETLVWAYWAAVLMGAVPSILPPLSDKLQPEKYRRDLAALIDISRPRAILTSESVIAASGIDVLGDRVSVIALDRVELPTTNVGASFAPGTDAQIALLQHSSGSTGLQKGVALSHRAIFNQLRAYSEAIKLSERDVIVSWLPLYHDMGLIACWLMPVLLGVPLVLMSPFDWVRAPVRLLQAVSQHGGTLCWLPNFALNFMANPARVRDRDLAKVSLRSLRGLINCSEPTYAASHAKFAARFANFGLNPDAMGVCYAMAENVFAVSMNGFGLPVREDFSTGRSVLSAGRPLPNVRVAVVDAAGVAAADGVVGEIAIHSDCMLTGYHNRPELTANAFVTLHGVSHYLTGDLGYLVNGDIHVTGRKKDLIIVGGKNVYPQDLEMLANDVPGIHSGRVVVFGVHDETAGTEEVAVLAESDATDAEQLEQIGDALRAHLTQSTDVAVRRVEILPPGSLIKTSSGKIARAANRDEYLRKLGLRNVMFSEAKHP